MKLVNIWFIILIVQLLTNQTYKLSDFYDKFSLLHKQSRGEKVALFI